MLMLLFEGGVVCITAVAVAVVAVVAVAVAVVVPVCVVEFAEVVVGPPLVVIFPPSLGAP